MCVEILKRDISVHPSYVGFVCFMIKKIEEIATIFLVSTCHHAEDHNLKQFFSFRIHTIT